MSTLLKQEEDSVCNDTAETRAERYNQDYQQLSCANCFTPIAFSPTHEKSGTAADPGLEAAKQKFKATHAIRSADGMVSENIEIDQSKLIQ